MPNEHHRPVLLEECVEALAVRPDGRYIDGTFGRGGHSRAILARLGPAGRLLGLDRDPEALAAGRELAGQDPRFSMARGRFAELGAIAERMGLSGQIDGILLDIGVSSPQLDDPSRGFSFSAEGPLDMRMDPDSGESAAQWLAVASEAEIARVLRELGEERFAGRIARAIVQARLQGPIRTTRTLATLCEAAVPSREPGKHPATRTFQAIRIHINRELDELVTCLAQVCDLLAAGGRLAVISFHSLEDRIVKRFVRDQARGERFPRGVPVTAAEARPRLRPIGRAIHASPAEVAANPRSRSAVLRVAERLP
ncbi:MAG TPA: 16S rRNA (cytosine(1402)-N(4))-methyltransferase RsmH [Chromatiaceae bacterium]|nr:16S rRNA (cytosine(1402)-N(4))-methyltransferase RsmH [Chromatiaceae bacterium]